MSPLASSKSCKGCRRGEGGGQRGSAVSRGRGHGKRLPLPGWVLTPQPQHSAAPRQGPDTGLGSRAGAVVAACSIPAHTSSAKVRVLSHQVHARGNTKCAPNPTPLSKEHPAPILLSDHEHLSLSLQNSRNENSSVS